MWLRRQQGQGLSDFTMATTALSETESSSSYLQLPRTIRGENRAEPVAYRAGIAPDQGLISPPELIIRLQQLQWDPRQATLTLPWM